MQLADPQKSTHALSKRRLVIRQALAVLGLSIWSANWLIAQQPSFDIPASPWSATPGVRQASSSGEGLAHTPARNFVKQPTGSTERVGRIRLEDAASEPSPRTGAIPPVASVQFGPLVPLDSANDPPSSSKTAKPTHTSTQTMPTDAQSGWNRVPASGLILDQGDVPDGMLPPLPSRLIVRGSRKGLPDRNDLNPIKDSAARTVSTERTNSHPPSSAEPKLTELTFPPTKEEKSDTIRLKPNPTRPPKPAPKDLTTVPSIQLVPHAPSDEALIDLATKGAEESEQVVAPKRLQETPTKTKTASIEPSLGLEQPAVQETVSKKQEAEQAERLRLAARLSHELLSANPQPMGRTPQALEQPPGFESVRVELLAHVERSNELLRRNAIYSAREESILGLRRLYRTLDLYRQPSGSESALDLALTAFREEADFHRFAAGTNQASSGSIAAIIDTHRTSALKGRDLQGISSEVASQHYRAFARYWLVVASDGHPWASDLLYALGKSFEREADADSLLSLMYRNQSVACYQAAMGVFPKHFQAASKLGNVLTQLDRVDEAYDALRISIEIQPQPDALNNLAELYRRRGAVDAANWAVQQATAILEQSPNYTRDNPEITNVPPETFSQISPMMALVPQSPGMNPGQAPVPSGQWNVPRTQAAPPARSAGNLFNTFLRK